MALDLAWTACGCVLVGGALGQSEWQAVTIAVGFFCAFYGMRRRAGAPALLHISFPLGAVAVLRRTGGARNEGPRDGD